MSHRIIESREAEWEGLERIWAHVQQFDPRRGSIRGHIIAAVCGGAIALVAVMGLGL